MKQRRPTRAKAPSQPLWQRWLAAFALAMVALVGTAEASHVHGDWLPKSGHTVHATASDGGLGGEEHCPICIAMHSALPAVPMVSPVVAAGETAKPILPVASAESTQWHYALFSRPPPPANS